MHIIHQEQDFLVINKPSGLLTHPNTPGEPSLVDELIAQFPLIINVGPDKARPGIVHRLDKETSGSMVIALTQNMYDHIRKQFDEGTVEKTYIALVYGTLQNNEGIIDMPLSRSTKGPFTTGEGGREAITHYRVVERYKKFSLVELHPKTGRTHQLRVHLKSIGHPIVGDPLYRAKLKVRIDFPRLFLHAASISFTDLSGARQKFDAPLPEELMSFLRKQESRPSL